MNEKPNIVEDIVLHDMKFLQKENRDLQFENTTLKIKLNLEKRHSTGLLIILIFTIIYATVLTYGYQQANQKLLTQRENIDASNNSRLLR